jgi:hypothetical protein
MEMNREEVIRGVISACDFCFYFVFLSRSKTYIHFGTNPSIIMSIIGDLTLTSLKEDREYWQCEFIWHRRLCSTAVLECFETKRYNQLFHNHDLARVRSHGNLVAANWPRVI